MNKLQASILHPVGVPRPCIGSCCASSSRDSKRTQRIEMWLGITPTHVHLQLPHTRQSPEIVSIWSSGARRPLQHSKEVPRIWVDMKIMLRTNAGSRSNNWEEKENHKHKETWCRVELLKLALPRAFEVEFSALVLQAGISTRIGASSVAAALFLGGRTVTLFKEKAPFILFVFMGPFARTIFSRTHLS